MVRHCHFSKIFLHKINDLFYLENYANKTIAFTILWFLIVTKADNSWLKSVNIFQNRIVYIIHQSR